MEHAQYILIANYELKQIDIYINIDINSCSPPHDCLIINLFFKMYSYIIIMKDHRYVTQLFIILLYIKLPINYQFDYFVNCISILLLELAEFLQGDTHGSF